jgi:ribonuclease HI
METKEEGKIERVTIYIDGASRSNPGPSSIAVVVDHPDPKKSMVFSEKIGKHTNNDAEFYALKKAIELCHDHGWEDPIIFTDSLLVANVSVGRWRLRSPSLKKLVEDIAHCMVDTKKDLGSFNPMIKWVPRTEPRIMEADRLCNEALDRII